MKKFTCDMCGIELEQHGRRYVVHVDAIPRSYSSWYKNYDLCGDCKEKLDIVLSMGGRQK